MNLLYNIAETVVCIFLYCVSNKGHKTPKSQDYPTAPGHGMGSERLYEVYFPSSPLQPATESATSTASNLRYLSLLIYTTI